MQFINNILDVLPTLPKRFQSRKFWVTLGVSFIIVFGEAVGIELDETQVWQLVGVVGAWLGIQGAADFKKVI